MNSEFRMQNAEFDEVDAEEETELHSAEFDEMAAEEEPSLPSTEKAQVSNRAHLTSSVPRGARLPRGVLTKAEMSEIRSIFGDMDDAEIQRLYKRVTK